MLEKYMQQKNEFDYLSSVVESFPLGKTLSFLLVGPPGCGKTLFGVSLAKHFNCPYYIIDGSPQMDRRDIEGCWELRNGETIFTFGPLGRAFNKANEHGMAFVIFNEPNAVRPSEQISLNAALAESHINLISTGKRIELNPDAKLVIVGTMNTNVLGINNLQEAFFDRFYLQMKFHYPNERKEIEIIKECTGCNHRFASTLVEIAQELRKAATEDKVLTNIFSTRLSIHFSEIVLKMKDDYLKENIKAIIINKLSCDERERRFVKDLLQGKDFYETIKEALRDEE